MKIYDPGNWYWFVGGDTTKVFSSKTGDYVPATDATFVAWAADGSMPTRIDTEANLGAVLAPYNIRPVNAGVLDGYLTSQANDIVAHPTFKPTFFALQQIAALQGSTEPTVADAVAYVKSVL